MDSSRLRTLNDVEVDVAVVGGGPAGAAAAACCAMRGLRTMLIERTRFPRERPGETLHALAEQIFDYLGVRERVLAQRMVRNTGTWIAWNGVPSFRPFAGKTGLSLGFQAPGDMLDPILFERARELGAVVYQPCDALGVIVDGNRVCGVTTAHGAVRSKWVIDAAGRRHWLARRLGVPVDRTSPRLLAHFGYATGACPARDDAPLFAADGDGWTWTARIGDGRYHWTRVSWIDERASPRRPAEFAELEPLGRTRAIDVTWRSARAPAGPGYWCVGDAAAVVDPAGSHGVIRALTAGITVADLCSEVTRSPSLETTATESYRAWVTDGFTRDTSDLRAKYSAVARGDLWKTPPTVTSVGGSE